MNRMLYIIGPPGVGKSTLMAEITRGQPRVESRIPFAITIYSLRVVELGRARSTFGGTDSLSMSVQPKVVDWLRGRPYPWILGEGDRLANDKFFRAVSAAGYELMLVYLAGDEIAAQRRAARAAELGAEQGGAWVRGRETKHRRLAVEWNALIMPAGLPPDGQAQILRDGGWHPFDHIPHDRQASVGAGAEAHRG